MSTDTPDRRDELASLKNWGPLPEAADTSGMAAGAVVDCGWGRLIFGQTFEDPTALADEIREEEPGRRDVAFYVREPQVVLANSPQELFLDPSLTYRLWFESGIPEASDATRGLTIREARPGDEAAVNKLYLSWSMVPVHDDFVAEIADDDSRALLVAEDEGGQDGDGILGVVMGIDHARAFDDPDNGSSLWALAVDPQAPRPGIGEALVLALAHRFQAAGRAFMDLSVMHDNEQAIALYQKLGFVEVPIYAVKRKNSWNENLYVGPRPDLGLNAYAQIIVDEARRRGIAVEIEDQEAGLFRLSFGGRSVTCRESLSEMTSAVAMSRCDDKALTRRLLERAGLDVPAQIAVKSMDDVAPFLERHGRIVVKPARGEQGRGITVGISTLEDAEAAVERARKECDTVLAEAYIVGRDLRIIVIDGAVVAAAERRPPEVHGDGVHTVADLIDKQSRRREKATHGESRIPVDEETRRCVAQAGYAMDDVPPAGERLTVRLTANLHTGGTIHDVTPNLHPTLARAAVDAAHALDIPVVGFDFIIDDPAKADYTIIEANERPGLANHEPQPTAEKFIDFLFPMVRPDRPRAERSANA